MKIEEIIKHAFGAETRTDEQWQVLKAKIKAEEAKELDIFKMFKKTSYSYLNKGEQRQVARIIKRYM